MTVATRGRFSARNHGRGFTLIELMIVVSIIGILAAIAVPKFADLIRKSLEGATKGNLGAIRGAINIYYSDMEGVFPDYADDLTISAKYMSIIPDGHFPPYHGCNKNATYPRCNVILNGGTTSSVDFRVMYDYLSVFGTGWVSWYYVHDPVAPDLGQIVADCGHTDSKGNLWTSY